MREPIFTSDGEVDPICQRRITADNGRQAPRVPRDRVLTTGGLWWFVAAVGAFVYGAVYMGLHWWHS